MTWTSLFPSYWWALLGLLVPLLIHLWNKREGKRILVGSLQWMEEDQEKRPSRLQFDDVWLFLLRALLVVGVVLLLVGFQRWEAVEAESRKWVYVGSELMEQQSIQTVVARLQEQEYTLKIWPDTLPQNNAWAFLQSIDFLHPELDSVVLLTPPLVAQWQHARPHLSFGTKWLPTPVQQAPPFILEAWETGNEVRLIIGMPTDTAFRFRPISLPKKEGGISIGSQLDVLLTQNNAGWMAQLGAVSFPVKKELKKRLAIRYGSQFLRQRQYLEAAIRAVEAYTLVTFEVDSQLETEPVGAAEVVFWLSSLEEPVLPVPCISLDHPALFNQLDAPKPELARHLLELFFNSYVEQAMAYDLRLVDARYLGESPTLSPEQAAQLAAIQAQNDQLKTQQQAPPSYQFWLWVVLIIIFVMERIYGYQRQLT